MKAVFESLKKDNFWVFLLLVGVFAVLGTTEVAFAQNNSKVQNFKTFLTDPFFKGAIDLTLLILAGYKWFSYINNFNPSNAFMEALVPAALTFFAFQWTQVLNWVGLN